MTHLLALIPSFGASELLLILAIVVILFGAAKLPALGRGLGGFYRNLREGLKDDPADEEPAPGRLDGRDDDASVRSSSAAPTEKTRPL